MSYPVASTPVPSVHYLPGESRNTLPFGGLGAQAIGKALIDEILAQVLLAVSGIHVLGGTPFAGLAIWAHELQAQALDALTGQQTANDNLAALLDGVLGTGSTFEDLAARIAGTPTPSDLQGVLAAAADNLDGTASPLASFLFNGDGTVSITGLLGDAEAAVKDFFDGTATPISGLVFNGDGTAS